MKKFVYFVLFIMILSLLPISAYAENDVIGEVYAFIEEHGSDPDNSGHKRYCAEMNGGGTFNIALTDNNKYVRCWLEDSQTDGDSFYKYEFAIILKAPFTGDIEWSSFIEDENGTNSATGKIGSADNMNSELACDEYSGDGYLKKSFMENAQNFRDALILAIANDLNYYLDRNLDFIGINPQFLCVEGHSFGEWVYQKNATKQANGTEKRQCNTCFATEEREVEGTMIQVPQNTVTETVPQKSPEQQKPDEPVNPPKPKPETESTSEPESKPQLPDYQFEIEQPEEDDNGQTDDKPKKTLPRYALPLGIVIAAVVTAVAVVLVIKTKHTKKQDDDEDLFRM